MKKITKKIFIVLMPVFLCMLDPSISKAQVISDPGCDPLDPACPIDGGVYILLAAGIGIAARKASKMNELISKVPQ